MEALIHSKHSNQPQEGTKAPVWATIRETSASVILTAEGFIISFTGPLRPSRCPSRCHRPPHPS